MDNYNKMRIVVAPDSFKDCLPAREVAASISRGIRYVYPQAEICEIPLSDGGEGLLESMLQSLGGKVFSEQVQDPLGRPITAEFGVLGDGLTAIIELARASGLELLADGERNPLRTSTYGTGQLIKAALDQGCTKIIVGLGGSATNDGGTGLLRALGAQFLDAQGLEIGEGGGVLNRLHHIDLSSFDDRIAHTEVVVASDVTNPLTGPNGASFIYGPQKGGDQQAWEQLDRNLNRYGEVIWNQFGIEVTHRSGAGAAGGTGAALLAFLNGSMVNGIDLVLEMVGMEQVLKDADLVITGEGKIDGQTLNGKTIVGISRMAKKMGIPVLVLTGKIGEDIAGIYEMGVHGIFPIVDRPMALEESIRTAPRLLERATRNLMGAIKAFK